MCLSGGARLSKFMQSLGDAAYSKLRKIANERDITVQELIRAIVIPDWLKTAEKNNGSDTQTERHRKRISRSRARTPIGPIGVISRPKKRQ
jgi:hypothetical protein